MKNQNKLDDKLISEALRIMEDQYVEHEEFNEGFDDELLEISGFAHSKSRALYWLDNAAYYEAKEEWNNQELLDRHSETISLINDNLNSTTFKGLINAVKRQQIVPFVGAGLSKSMRMPLWDEALEEIRIKIQPDNVDIKEKIKAGEYLSAAQDLAAHDQVITNNYIRTKYKVNQLEGAVRLLPEISQGCIVTTNFDDAIEESFKLKNIVFDGYMHGTQQHNFFARLVKGQSCLLKLHGDVDDPQTYIFTEDQYNNAYGAPFDFTCPLPKALRQLYISNSLLFLGCGLEQDKTLNIFKDVMDKGEYETPEHYAVLPEPQAAADKNAKESFLVGLNIQPIWYPHDEHQYVEAFLSLAIDMANGLLPIKTLD